MELNRGKILTAKFLIGRIELLEKNIELLSRFIERPERIAFNVRTNIDNGAFICKEAMTTVALMSIACDKEEIARLKKEIELL